MTSYLFSISALQETISNENRSNLLHLIRLSLSPVSLKIDLLFDSRLPKHVMAPKRAFGKTKRQQQGAKVFETNVCIASATQNLLESLLILAQTADETSTVLLFLRHEPALLTPERSFR